MAWSAAGADRGCRPAQRSRPRGEALIAYFDSSAFVKLIVPEAGSADAVLSWSRAQRRVSSVLLYAETRAALARARKIGRVARPEARRARQLLDALWTAVEFVGVSERLVESAAGVAEHQGLRAYDAVHLASAASIADVDTVFVAADGDLLRAAEALGLPTIRTG